MEGVICSCPFQPPLNQARKDMKIKLQEIYEDYDYWMKEIMLMQYDLEVEIDGKMRELYGIRKGAGEISYVDAKGNIINVPDSQIEYIHIGERDKEELRRVLNDK